MVTIMASEVAEVSRDSSLNLLLISASGLTPDLSLAQFGGERYWNIDFDHDLKERT